MFLTFLVYRCSVNSPIYFVIENTKGLTNPKCDAFAKRFKDGIATPLDQTIKNEVVSISVLALKQKGLQYYDANKLHERPHYMTQESMSQIKIKYAPRPVLNDISTCEPTAAEIGFNESEWLILKDQVLAEGSVNVRGNTVLTKGFSGQNMRKKREEGGQPCLTTSYMSETVAHSVTPLLNFLTLKASEKDYMPRGGGCFANELLTGNFYEAVAVAVTRGPDVVPHMDRENDWRDGFDIMGAITFSGSDDQGYFRIGVFGYTRKCVGDYLDWVVKKEQAGRISGADSDDKLIAKHGNTEPLVRPVRARGKWTDLLLADEKLTPIQWS